MQNLAPSVHDDEETVEQLEGHRRHGEEVERYYHLAVIRQESLPTLAGIAAVAKTAQIAGDGSFRDDEPQLLEFAVDLGCAPTGILLRQTGDQRPGFRSRLRSAAARSGSPSPEEPETCPVPADYGIGFHHDENVGPTRPDSPQADPEQPVQAMQSRSRPFPLEDGELLPQGEDLQSSVPPAAEEDSQGGEGS